MRCICNNTKCIKIFRAGSCNNSATIVPVLSYSDYAVIAFFLIILSHECSCDGFWVTGVRKNHNDNFYRSLKGKYVYMGASKLKLA